MITRSKLVEQLREHQIRSQTKYSSALTLFSPKPHFSYRRDVAVAVFWASVFFMLLISVCVAYYLEKFLLCLLIICLGVFLPMRLRSSRQALGRKRERRMFLLLSM